MSKLTVCFAMLCMLASPAGATPQSDRQAQVEAGPTPATAQELAGYAQRERTAQKQEKFEGGRVHNDTLITVILILVVVILVLAII